jgi:hypothetical protein
MLWMCVADRQIEVFREMLEECQLSELGFKGSKFTWCNNRTNHNFTKERLDKVVANSGWYEKFRVVEVIVLAVRSFGHCPLLVTYGNGRRFFRRRSFKFEAS